MSVQRKLEYFRGANGTDAIGKFLGYQLHMNAVRKDSHLNNGSCNTPINTAPLLANT